ncbi:hypothetical protein GXP67_30620 [Rhodocytophaga rosea]|uniref:Uncharacterized protein n=1 Tax=Rhodocytophaga rosea TaxID=2704465 RepID=A0A6C0GT24_9BACT|nr:hypothetical protein [Rhodocytophaga rosea]QHT70693.1 hypothetical protein GXP67_30620 [Rhodocytophaga rosea]
MPVQVTNIALPDAGKILNLYMKIGFVVHFFDFRNDVRKVIDIISQQHQVVLFVRKEDLQQIKSFVNDRIEVRMADENLPTSQNLILNNLFRFLGKLPESIQNYYLMEVFKISLNPAPVQKKARFWLDLSMKLPRIMTYDYYLNHLQYKGATPIDDIDEFICFTDISDSYLLARLIRERKKVKIYVYSWDHPCKQVKYSNQVDYLVWNEGIREDMIKLQHIHPERIQITGASQFAYVDQFLSIPEASLSKPFSFPYIYFGCAIGAPEIATDEIKVIRLLSQAMQKHLPDVRLVVRPYPVMKDWSIYESLKELPNVILDDKFRSKDLSVQEDFIMEKFIKIHFAEAFIHLGTTLGFEACFTETPSIIIDFEYFQQDKSLLSIKNFVHQYQNDKYLLLKEYPNVVHSEKELKELFQGLLPDKTRYLAYNKAVRDTTPLKKFEQFASQLIYN